MIAERAKKFLFAQALGIPGVSNPLMPRLWNSEENEKSPSILCTLGLENLTEKKGKNDQYRPC